MKSYAVWLFFFIACITTQAQNTLTGVVKDINSEEPIAFANIYLPTIERGGITNENGFFTINDLPNGEHKIIVSIIGYETYETALNFPYTGNLEIRLNSSAIEMDEIILSTPFHKLQKDNVMKVEQKKIAELQSNGAVTLADGISDVSGVATLSTGIGIGKPVIRGLSSNRVLVYAQGVRLENQQYGDEHGLGLSSSGIESIEVIKGPASLLYGSDALGGVLYINPERFAAQNSSSGDINFDYFSNTEGHSTSAGFKSSTESIQLLFRGSTTQHADYKNGDYRVTNTRFKEKDFKAALGYRATDFTTELRYNVNASHIGIPEELGAQEINYAPMLPNQKISNHMFSSKSKFFLENSSFELNLGFTYNDRKEFEEHHHHDEDDEDHEDEDHEDEDHEDEDHEDEDHEGEEEDEDPALHMKLKTFSYDLKYNLPKVGKFETIIGVQGMSQTNTNYGEEELIPNATTNDIGILSTSHIHFDNLDLQLGVRYDKRNISVGNILDKDYNSFNGAFGLKTNLSSNLISRVNIATGFRAPNLAELTSDGSHEGTNRYEIGNPNLDNEQNYQLDVSLEYTTEHLEIFANGFYNNVSNYIYLSPNGDFIDDDPVFLYLQEDANLYGGEFGLHFHPHPLDWLHIENTFETVTGKLDDDSYLPLIPANELTNTIRIEFENNWFKNAYSFIRLNTVFDQQNVSGFETSTDGYSLLSLGIGGEINAFGNPLRVRISGTNLTNKVYVSHLSRLKPDGIYNIGRNISFGLSYNL